MTITEVTLRQWKELRTGYWPTDLANASALLYERMPDLNWAGFYLLDGETLRLGPFQGRIACTTIPPGKGVCGRAVQEKRTLLVADVHEFSGHIACDSRSRAELVVPLIRNGAVWGVLDLDSPTPGRFTPAEGALLEEFCGVLLEPWDRAPWRQGSDTL
jgi:GAF domain-containing protein